MVCSIMYGMRNELILAPSSYSIIHCFKHKGAQTSGGYKFYNVDEYILLTNGNLCMSYMHTL